MHTTSRLHRQARGLLLLGICLLVLSAFPTSPLEAAIRPIALDNTLADFTRGTFQRSSLSALQVPSDSKDAVGAVQLLPVGTLNDWIRTPFNLPEKLTDIGAVAIGTHIFVVGGLTGLGTSRGPTAAVWSASIDPTTGAPIQNAAQQYWSAELALPAVAAADGTSGVITVAARSVPAMAAVQTGPDSGYIYVIGGNIQPNLSTTVSSYGVNIATVSNGHITSWAAGPQLPSFPPYGAVGLQSASAVSFVAGGKTYIYLIGGLERFKNGGKYQLVGSKQVFYAQVGSGGQLTKPTGAAGTSAWAPLAPLSIPTDLSNYAGLWDTAVVAERFQNGGNGLYVMGGQYQATSAANPPEVNDVYSNDVYRAVIQNDGTLAWQQDLPAPTLPEGRVGHSGVQFNGAIYLTGGAPAGDQLGQSERAVLSSYIDDNAKLAQIGQSGSSFLRSATTLPVPRARHATVVVRATPTLESPNPAYAYVIAGQGSTIDQDPSDDQGSDTLIMGRIGTSQDTTQKAFAPSGWYYSKVHDTVFTGAQVQEILWSTVITRPADIQLEYRTSTDSDCDNPATLEGLGWTPADGSLTDAFFSKNGLNTFSLGTPPPAHCFQYRAKLVNGAAGLLTTPALLNVNIKVQVPGNPDLKVQTLTAFKDTQNRLTSLSIEILNHNDLDVTQPADVELGGSFFVDLFVYGPNATNVVTPTIPFTTAPSGDLACVDIPKKQMGVDAKITITQWFDVGTCTSQSKNILDRFSEAGHYVVFVAVDTGCAANRDGTFAYGCLFEGSVQNYASERNNIKRIEFDISGRVNNRYMPIIYRNP